MALGQGKGIPLSEEDLEESLWDLYERWQSHHGVAQSHYEKHLHFGVFKENAKSIHESNKMEKGYTLSLNKFGDMTRDEFRSTYAGSRSNRHRPIACSKKAGRAGGASCMRM